MKFVSKQGFQIFGQPVIHGRKAATIIKRERGGGRQILRTIKPVGLCYELINCGTGCHQASDHLVGIVVKVSASRAEDPGLESRLHIDFSGIESYQ